MLEIREMFKRSLTKRNMWIELRIPKIGTRVHQYQAAPSKAGDMERILRSLSPNICWRIQTQHVIRTLCINMSSKLSFIMTRYSECIILAQYEVRETGKIIDV
ncbi:hypothetical protein AB6A40_006969 [Gnathostoma spinigerum]|uniref:Uncharacterized protein n=1 Tax=Gnathostoma spinigerum TaxID=75299 RepID=A0ABD6EL37_9BILA